MVSVEGQIGNAFSCAVVDESPTATKNPLALEASPGDAVSVLLLAEGETSALRSRSAGCMSHKRSESDFEE